MDISPTVDISPTGTDSVCNLPTTDMHFCDCSSILIECSANVGGITAQAANDNEFVGNTAKSALSVGLACGQLASLTSEHPQALLSRAALMAT